MDKTKPKTKATPVVKAKAAPVVKAKAAPVVKAKAAPVVKAKAAPVVKAKAAPVRTKKLTARTKPPVSETLAMPIDSVDAPRIEAHLIVGETAALVDVASLEHTLGTGAWAQFPGREPGLGPGLVDTWPDSVWVGLLVHLGLPADPLDRTTARLPVTRLVQRIWFKAVKGDYPEDWKTDAEKRDVKAIADYEVAFPIAKDMVEVKRERGAMNLAKARETMGPRSSSLAGKKIKVLNAKHGAREGSKRAIGLDIILKSKTTDEALPLLTKAGCNGSFITFAVAQEFIELV